MAQKAAVTILPLGSLDLSEMETVTKRVAKCLGLEVALGKAIPLPVGHFDPARSQSDARKLIGAVPGTITPPRRPAPGKTADPTATSAAALSPIESWGSRVHGPPTSSPAGAPGGPTAAVTIGVTDADMFSGYRDFVFVHVESEQHRAIVATKRLKEAFWKRKSDPPRQQTRLVREIIGAAALAAGAQPCENPTCPASSARGPLDIDQKGDRLCPNCDRKLRGGSIRL